MGKRYPVSIDLDSLAALRIEAEITNLMDLAGIPALQIDGAPAEPPPAELPTGKAPLAEVIHRLRAGLMIFNEDVRCAAIDLVETLLRQAREKLGDSDFDIIKGQLTDDLVGLA